VATINGLENPLLAVHWPSPAETDVHALVTDHDSIKVAVVSGDGTALTTAVVDTQTALNIVRFDLGLPPSNG
jgi:hypothetical protein